MTRALTIILVLALPLAARETSGNGKAADTTTTAAPATSTAAPAQADSPLVAAAKRASRRGRKPANVITNESLKSSGANAHVTTTAKQDAIKMPRPLEPPRDTPEMAAAKAKQAEQARAAVQAQKDRKAKEEQARKAEAEAEAREAGYDGSMDDAAEFTGSNPPPPQF